jgi:hemolysin activation/secretion protein
VKFRGWIYGLCVYFFATNRFKKFGAVSKLSLRQQVQASVSGLLAILLFAPCLSFAANIPDQELLRQQERERALRRSQEQIPDVRLEQAPVPAESTRIPDRETPCFTVSRIALVGDSAERFQFALASVVASEDTAVGRCLGVQGINAILARAQNAVIAKGYVTTRILAAPQNLATGELALTVLPGRIRAIRFSPDSSPRVTQWNALPARPGDLLNLRDIEQALENFKRVPTAEADIQIEPASGPDARPGESDLIIRYRQALPFRLSLTVDDGGSKATGKYQGGITLSGDNLLALNDLFYASLNHDLGGGESGDRGTRGYTVHYSLPFGYWLLGLTSNEYYYHQAVAGANQAYVYSGDSRTHEVKLSRVVYRDAVRKTTASLRSYLRTSKNYIDDTEVEVQRRRMAGWEASLDHREFMGLAILDLGLAYRRGTGAYDAIPAPEENFNEGTARPKIVTADASFVLPFGLGSQLFRYSATYRAQWNSTPLVPQDRFSIGGRYSVRGFDGEVTLSAERGWLLRNDLGLALGDTGQELYLGFDYGHVGGSSAEFLLGTHLAGAVLGLRGGYKGFHYDVFAGTPISKPDGFEAGRSVGFNLVYQY